MGCPALQLNACWNSGILITTPLIRYLPGECGLVIALTRRFSSTLILAGPLRQSDKEALVRREALAILQSLALGGCLPCDVSQDRAAQICHVFAFGQLAVDLDVIHDGVLSVLVHHALGALFKVLSIFLGPPVAQIAFGIKLAAFIVKPVREFVANG